MILSKQRIAEKINDIKENPFNYLVLNTEHIFYGDDKDRLELCVELANMANSLNFINNIYKKMGATKRINIQILFQASQHVLEDKPFSNEQLMEYYQTMQDFEEANSLLEKFTDLDHLYLGYELEFVLLGMPLDEQKGLVKKNEKIVEEFHDRYGDEYMGVRFKEKGIKTFINFAKKLLEEARAKGQKVDKAA